MASERTTHSSIQVMGLMMMTVAVVFIVGLLLVRGETEDIGPFAVVSAVAVVATFLVWRFDKTWARVVGLLGTLAVGFGAFFIAFGVFQPFSPIEFIVGLLFLLGFLLSLIWGVMALTSGIRGREGLSRGDRALRRWVPPVVGVLSVVSIAGFFVTRESVSSEAAAGATELEMVDFEFSPEATATGGKLLVHNSDPFAHDFTLDDLDVYAYVGPGSETIVDLSGAAPGTYTFICSLHTDPSTGEGMTGEITVEA